MEALTKPRAVSIRADRTYIKALREFAEDSNKTVADIVREALDAHIGDALEPRVVFFAQRERDKVQLEADNA
jgi:predicted DNA-binding protein